MFNPQHFFQPRRFIWVLAVGTIALLVMSPLLAVLSSFFINTSDIWNHLLETVLRSYILNSLWLMLGVGSGTLLIGVGAAWLVTMCQFPGSRWLEWALLLPLAAPAYVLAYVYTDWLEFPGAVQTMLRQWFGWQYGDYWFPEIRSLPGGIIILVLVFYPYVYLLARIAFLEQATCTLEASRSLGCNPWQSFIRVALPLARPSILSGLALVLMETLNDFGTVQFFGIDTFTTGIYRTWISVGDRPAAMQMSALLMFFVLWLIWLERWSRGQAQYSSSNRYQALNRYVLRGWRSTLAMLGCWLPVILGSLLPTGILLTLIFKQIRLGEQLGEFWKYATNSLILALVTAGLLVVLSLVIAYGLRLQANNRLLRSIAQFSLMGYAIPGSVIAVGVLVPIGALDNGIDAFARQHLGFSTGLLLSGTIVALVFAYSVRFLIVAFNPVETSLGRIRPSFDDAARSLGHGSTSTLLRIHLPIMGGSLLTAIMLAFVDVMKELPATLIIRPFNFDTLAIRTYQLASDERLAEAAAPALAIVLVGLIPVIFLSAQIAHSRHRQPENVGMK